MYKLIYKRLITSKCKRCLSFNEIRKNGSAVLLNIIQLSRSNGKECSPSGNEPGSLEQHKQV